MAELQVNFILENIHFPIQCSKKEKMKNICDKFAKKIDKDINSITFLYKGKPLNFEQTFNEQVNIIDKNINEMEIIVFNKDDNKLSNNEECKLIKINEREKDEIILFYNKVADLIKGTELKIENMYKYHEKSMMDNELKNINIDLNSLYNDILKNNDKLKAIFNDKNKNIINIDNKVKLKEKELSTNNKNIKNTKIKNIYVKANEKSNNYKNKNLFENVHSKYITKIIYSYLNEKIKLKLIKYNKIMQDIININIIDYRYYSGRYIEYSEDGKGKEYSGEFDELIYEGEYLHGERNGKGKEYYKKGILEFEGEYLKGKRNGQGKEYDQYNILMFEGIYLNGKIFKNIIYDE